MKDMTGDELEVLKYTSNRLLSIEPLNHDKLNAEFRKKITSRAESIVQDYYAVLFDSDSDKGEEILVSVLSKQCAENGIKDIINVLSRFHTDVCLKSTVTGTTVSVATESKYYEEILKEAMK